MAIIPVVRGLYVCEQVDVDPKSTNLTLHRCFRSFRFSSVPYTARPFFVVANLANGYGRLLVRTTITRFGSSETLFDHTAEITIGDRLREVRFKLQVVCTFPSVGSYDIMLEVNGELVALSPLTIQLLEDKA